MGFVDYIITVSVGETPGMVHEHFTVSALCWVNGPVLSNHDSIPPLLFSNNRHAWEVAWEIAKHFNPNVNYEAWNGDSEIVCSCWRGGLEYSLSISVQPYKQL